MNITPVILCGGSGTRLWPLSRADYPKQFIKLEDNITLFQKTINRIKLLLDCTKRCCNCIKRRERIQSMCR